MLNYSTTEQKKIDRELTRIKRHWEANLPICIFCRHYVKPGEGQLAHKIRRSETSTNYSRFELQTMYINTGLAHHDCHEIFDNVPEEAILLPGFPYVMNDIWIIDPLIFNRLMMNFFKQPIK